MSNIVTLTEIKLKRQESKTQTSDTKPKYTPSVHKLNEDTPKEEKSDSPEEQYEVEPIPEYNEDEFNAPPRLTGSTSGITSDQVVSVQNIDHGESINDSNAYTVEDTFNGENRYEEPGVNLSPEEIEQRKAEKREKVMKKIRELKPRGTDIKVQKTKDNKKEMSSEERKELKRKLKEEEENVKRLQKEQEKLNEKVKEFMKKLDEEHEKHKREEESREAAAKKAAEEEAARKEAEEKRNKDLYELISQMKERNEGQTRTIAEQQRMLELREHENEMQKRETESLSRENKALNENLNTQRESNAQLRESYAQLQETNRRLNVDNERHEKNEAVLTEQNEQLQTKAAEAERRATLPIDPNAIIKDPLAQQMMLKFMTEQIKSGDTEAWNRLQPTLRQFEDQRTINSLVAFQQNTSNALLNNQFEQSRQLNNTFNNLAGTYNNLVQRLGVVENTLGNLQSGQHQIIRNQDQTNQGLNSASDRIMGSLGTITTNTTNINTGVTNLQGQMTGMSNQMTGLSNQVTEVGSNVKDVKQGVQKMEEDFKEFEENFKEFTETQKQFKELQIQTLKEYFEQIQSEIKRTELLSRNFEHVITEFKNYILSHDIPIFSNREQRSAFVRDALRSFNWKELHLDLNGIAITNYEDFKQAMNAFYPQEQHLRLENDTGEKLDSSIGEVYLETRLLDTLMTIEYFRGVNLNIERNTLSENEIVEIRNAIRGTPQQQQQIQPSTLSSVPSQAPRVQNFASALDYFSGVTPGDLQLSDSDKQRLGVIIKRFNNAFSFLK